jgi:small-conductance mechanosensitive channel
MGFISDLWRSIDFQQLLNKVVIYLPTLVAQAVAAAVVLAAFAVAYVVARRLLRAYTRSVQAPETIADLLVTLLKYGTIVLALVTAASQFDIKVTSLVAGLGLAGLAVSFAAQETVANIICGITLVIDRPFAVGDWVEVGGVHAHVSGIRLRTTTLTTFDNQTIVLPNRSIAQERIVNYTLVPTIRVRVPVGIAYKEDIRAARQALLSTLADDGEVLPEPAPEVVVTGLGSSSVELELRFWIKDASLQQVKQWDYLERCKYALDEAAIEIPFPHVQVLLERS